jgi:hypothetical protein
MAGFKNLQIFGRCVHLIFFEISSLKLNLKFSTREGTTANRAGLGLVRG